MKYFTPAWYNDTVVSEIYTQLRKTQNAAEFSEKFYEKLRKIEQRAFLRYSKRIARFNREKLDVDAVLKQFDANYEENLAFIKVNLPEDILTKVKDIRVLALGSAEYDVAAQIERFCGEVSRRCRAIESSYDEQLQEVANVVGRTTVNLLDALVGSSVASIKTEDDCITIVASPENADVSYTVDLTGGAVLSTRDNVMGALIVQHELTIDGDKLAFGLLCLDESSNAFSVEFSAQSVSIKNI